PAVDMVIARRLRQPEGSSEKSQQLCDCRIGRLLRHTMAALECLAGDERIRFLAPGLEYVELAADGATRAPQDEQWRGDAPARYLIGCVMLEVDRGGRPIIFTGRVDCAGSGECFDISIHRSLVDGAFGLAPARDRVAQIVFRVGADEALGEPARLDE